MKENNSTQSSTDRDTRLLLDALGKPGELRRRLILAVALGPPKGRRRPTAPDPFARFPRGGK